MHFSTMANRCKLLFGTGVPSLLREALLILNVIVLRCRVRSRSHFNVPATLHAGASNTRHLTFTPNKGRLCLCSNLSNYLDGVVSEGQLTNH